MMIGPFDFHAPSSPFPRYNALSGQKLFEQASELYAWYGSWDKSPCDHTATYEHLSTIMLLAKMHIEGGNYLRAHEEEKAFSDLLQLCHELYLGSKTDKHLPESLESIIDILTEENARAKLVAITIKLDYRIRIRPCIEQTADEGIQALLHAILSKVTADLTEDRAQIAAQKLSELLEGVSGEKGISENEVIERLNEAVETFCA